MKKTMAIVMAVMLASLLFVFVQALRIHVAFNLPERILQMLPYLLTLAMLPEPVRMIRSAMRSIALFSPDEAIIDDIRARTGKVLEGYPFDPVFYDVTMTGRRLWVSIYFTTSHDLISFTELELANAQMLSELQTASWS